MSDKKTPHHITLTVGALHGLKAILTRPDLVTETDDIYRAGKLVEDVLPDGYGEVPDKDAAEPVWKAWADQVVECDLTEKQRNTAQKVIKAAAGKNLLGPGKHTNRLLEQFGLVPTDE